MRAASSSSRGRDRKNCRIRKVENAPWAPKTARSTSGDRLS
jgi:hypothetical protein